MTTATSQDYKGLTITQRVEGDNFVVVDSYNQPLEGFNPDGYKTLNNAKGAVTKHLQAIGVEPFAGSLPAPAKAATSEGADRTSAPAQEWTTQQNLNGDPIHANPRMAHVYAELDYFGMTKARDTRSRAKRDGVYGGTHDGKPIHNRQRTRDMNVYSSTSDEYAPNRKARKAAKLNARKGA